MIYNSTSHYITKFMWEICATPTNPSQTNRSLHCYIHPGVLCWPKFNNHPKCPTKIPECSKTPSVPHVLPSHSLSDSPQVLNSPFLPFNIRSQGPTIAPVSKPDLKCLLPLLRPSHPSSSIPSSLLACAAHHTGQIHHVQKSPDAPPVLQGVVLQTLRAAAVKDFKPRCQGGDPNGDVSLKWKSQKNMDYRFINDWNRFWPTETGGLTYGKMDQEWWFDERNVRCAPFPNNSRFQVWPFKRFAKLAEHSRTTDHLSGPFQFVACSANFLPSCGKKTRGDNSHNHWDYGTVLEPTSPERRLKPQQKLDPNGCHKHQPHRWW